MESSSTILDRSRANQAVDAGLRVGAAMPLEPGGRIRLTSERHAAQTRDLRIDSLRVAGALAIVWLHASARVIGQNPDVHNTAWWIGNVADSFSRWGVPVFIMISGALLLARPIDLELGRYYRRRAARLLAPLAFWSAFYLGLLAFRMGTFDAYLSAKLILIGRPAPHLWFLYMIVGLYLFAPFLRVVATRGTPTWRIAFISLCFAVATFEGLVETWKGGVPDTFLSEFPLYIAYFVAGHELLARPCRIRTSRLLALIVVCGALVALTTGALLPSLGQKSWYLAYSYQNPLVVVLSLCVFQLAVQRIDPAASQTRRVLSGALSRLAPITLGIYLIHPLWLELLAGWGIDGFLLHPSIGIPVTVAITFSLSAVTAALISAIPYLRAVVR